MTSFRISTHTSSRHSSLLFRPWLLVIGMAFVLSSSFLQAVLAQPLIHSTVQCTSSLVPGGFYTPVTDRLGLHWKLTGGGTPSAVLNAVVEYNGVGWVGLGVSPNGQMVPGSVAVVGSETGVNLYDLNSQTTAGVVVQDPTSNPVAQSLTGDFTQANGQTNLGFSVSFPTTTFPSSNGLYKMLIAAGETNALGYHRYRASFQLDLVTCGGTGTDPSAALNEYQVYDHRSAFAAHGFFAFSAFAIIIPFAVAAAWFRSLMPKWWIYIHVLSNCFAFFFTMLAVTIAFAGMILRGKSGTASSNTLHMSLAHHWVGLFLFLFVIFQVVNGFRRPPVEPKMDVMASAVANAGGGSLHGGAPGAGGGYQEPKTIGCAGQRTPRENWHLTHRITALVVLCLAIFQVQSGLTLFAEEYNATGSSKALRVFWIWLLSLSVTFLIVKLYLCGRERRHKRSNMIPRNIMPQRDEEDYEDNLGPHADSREFANVI